MVLHGVYFFLHPCRTTFPCRFLFVLGIIKNNCQSLVPERNKTLSPSDLSNYQCTTKKEKKRKKHAHPYFSSTPPPSYCSPHPTPLPFLFSPILLIPPMLSASFFNPPFVCFTLQSLFLSLICVCLSLQLKDNSPLVFHSKGHTQNNTRIEVFLPPFPAPPILSHLASTNLFLPTLVFPPIFFFLLTTCAFFFSYH
ncbi:hypothetical protein K457DRAFT_593732 [Linnemannia elongata AG-77]|uniref:Uncharacterized protein n=1 Tax=Linnemannia elongata AG-77 TaxID=1314771 RepID=A0A197JS48_9FUNG|nr:hypothetical protein K457DRAFT_593732 [Linnemannia elongata AG-77]